MNEAMKPTKLQLEAAAYALDLKARLEKTLGTDGRNPTKEGYAAVAAWLHSEAAAISASTL